MKGRNTLIFIVIVFISLGVISVVVPEEGIDIGIRKLYFPAIEDIIGYNGHSKLLFERLQAIEEELRLQRYRDSLYTDSLSHYISFFEKSPIRIDLPNNTPDFFNDFFADLDSCNQRGEMVRILHYGDSQIEADRISGYIRQFLQEKFGGNGPGLLPAVQPIPAFSVGQMASENIERYIIAGMHQNQATHGRYGVLGQFGEVDGESFISISTRNTAYENVKEFQTIRLFVGHDTNFTARLTLQGKMPEKPTVTSTSSPVKVYLWHLPTPVRSFSLHTSGSAEIYGIAVDGNSGVAVDNIPFRGSSGTFFNTMDQQVLSSMFQHLNARLIILEFGGNAVPVISDRKSIESYCNSLARQINFLRNICPEAKILFIGLSDMSTKVDGQLCTYPQLAPLIEAMKDAATQNGAAFWNMYEVMGGNNSMIEWVNHSPALAAPDYIHFTAKGVERIASLFCETLMVYYDYYRLVTNNEKLTCEKSPSLE